MKHSTIFALSSGAGLAGVAVVRISGPGSIDSVSALTRGAAVPPPRRAALRTLRNPETGEALDQALVLLFEGPASFTGEDVVELHLHGGRAVVEGVLDALASMDGLEPAGPGDFTRRAFEAGKLDLTEIEGLGDLLNAETSSQRRQALRQMGGSLSALYEGWREQLVRALAYLEADIDFPDEDLPEGVASQVAPKIASLKSEIEAHLSDGGRGQKLRDGFKIVILGRPNAGKSTLLNHLAQSEVAIVTDEAGTTRDVLEIRLDLGGFPVRVLDTAGLRSGEIGKVEVEGIRRAKVAADDADLKLVLVSAEDDGVIPEDLVPYLTEGFLVRTKADLGGADVSSRSSVGAFQEYSISVKTGSGLSDLLDAITGHVRDAMALQEAPALTRLRHRLSLQDCVEALERFESVGSDAVLAAEEVRLAARAIGKITGRVDVEDLLDVIFKDFCIGK